MSGFMGFNGSGFWVPSFWGGSGFRVSGLSGSTFKGFGFRVSELRVSGFRGFGV